MAHARILLQSCSTTEDGGSSVQLLSLRSVSLECAGCRQTKQQGSKAPKYGVSTVSVLGVVIDVWGTYFILGSLDP